MASRVAASIAIATGHGKQMIVHSGNEYEQRALDLAGGMIYDMLPPLKGVDANRPEARAQRRGKGELAQLRKQLFLTRESSPLFDTKRWVENMERGVVEAWRRWVNGTEFEGKSVVIAIGSSLRRRLMIVRYRLGYLGRRSGETERVYLGEGRCRWRQYGVAPRVDRFRRLSMGDSRRQIRLTYIDVPLHCSLLFCWSPPCIVDSATISLSLEGERGEALITTQATEGTDRARSIMTWLLVQVQGRLRVQRQQTPPAFDWPESCRPRFSALWS